MLGAVTGTIKDDRDLIEKKTRADLARVEQRYNAVLAGAFVDKGLVSPRKPTPASEALVRALKAGRMGE